MQIPGIVYRSRVVWLRLPVRTRLVAFRLGLIGMSFIAGLIVFYLPERKYSSVPEVWLPVAATTEQGNAASLPVISRPGAEKGMVFMAASPGGPELLAMEAADVPMPVASCPDVFRVPRPLPTECTKIGIVDGAPVYARSWHRSSRHVYAYTVRHNTLLVLRGVYSKQEALSYLDRLHMIAKRDVAKVLGANKEYVASADAARREQEREQAKEGKEAYKHLPFEPLLPATLPAGWVQHSIRIYGSEATRPERVEVLYKKGPERFVGYTMQLRSGFVMDGTCGPTLTANRAMIPCAKANNEDYYTGGATGEGYASWYLYRALDDVVATVHVSVYGPMLLFSEEDLQAQRLIARSLRPAAKERLKDAQFVDTAK